jgi:hypothetical protein
MTKIEEGILKKLTAPLRRRKLVKQNNKLADDHETAKTLDKVSDSQLDYSGKERGKSATAAIRSSRLQNKKRATPFGGLKEEMNPIKAGIKDIQEGRLEQMREKFNDSLARKAAEALQEKKLEIASNYFGQK